MLVASAISRIAGLYEPATFSLSAVRACGGYQRYLSYRILLHNATHEIGLLLHKWPSRLKIVSPMVSEGCTINAARMG